MVKFDTLDGINVIHNAYKEKKKYINTILYSKYIEDMKALWLKDAGEKRIVKIAPSLEDMYEHLVIKKRPASELKPREIFEFDPKSMGGAWSGKTTEKFEIHFGWKNGIRNEVRSTYVGNDPPAHIGGGGDTGNGKSVTINAALHTAFTQYPPWELKFYMADFKMVEFAMYGKKTPPHIEEIAATEDAGYAYSLIRKFEEDMQKMNKIFQAIDVKNIPGFRDKTGLVIPRNILIIDEFQQLFILMEKKTALLEKLFKVIAKLGRNTGYHLFLVSQSIAGTVSKDAMAQILGRFSMFTKEPGTSETIIGNPAASYKKEMGKLILNDTGGKEYDNVEIRVPFIDDKKRGRPQSPFYDSLDYIQGLSKKYPFKWANYLYDENKITEFDKLLNNSNIPDSNLFIIGDSTVTKPPGVARFEGFALEESNRENIIFLSKDMEYQGKVAQLLAVEAHSKKTTKSVSVLGFNKKTLITSDLESKLPEAKIDNERRVENNAIINILSSLVKKYQLIEQIISSYGYECETFAEALDKYAEASNMKDTVKEGLSKLAKKVVKGMSIDLDYLHKNKNYIVMLGMEASIGIGTGQKRKVLSSFENLLEEGPKYGIHSIMIARDFGESKSLLKMANHKMAYRIEERQKTKMKIEVKEFTDNIIVYSGALSDETISIKLPEIKTKEVKRERIKVDM